MPSFAPRPPRQSAPLAALASLAAVIGGVLAMAALSGCGGPDVLTGTLQTADAKGKDGVAMSGGWIAVFTTDQATDFWTQSGIDPPSGDGLAFVEGRVRHEAVAEAGGTLEPVDDHGKFRITVTGARQVCVLRELPQVDVLRGCATVDLPADGTLVLTVGADGVQAALDD